MVLVEGEDEDGDVEGGEDIGGRLSSDSYYDTHIQCNDNARVVSAFCSVLRNVIVLRDLTDAVA